MTHQTSYYPLSTSYYNTPYLIGAQRRAYPPKDRKVRAYTPYLHSLPTSYQPLTTAY